MGIAPAPILSMITDMGTVKSFILIAQFVMLMSHQIAQIFNSMNQWEETILGKHVRALLVSAFKINLIKLLGLIFYVIVWY